MRLITVIFIFCSCFNLKSQDFRLFQPGQDYIFHTNNMALGNRIDSTKISGGKTINYFPNFLISNNDTVWHQGPSPFGNGIIENFDSSFTIFSNYNDTLLFNPHLSMGDTLTLGKKEKVEVRYYLKTDKVEVVLDTAVRVRTYGFFVLNSSTIDSTYYPNGKELKIAETLGVIKSINFSAIFKQFDFKYPYPFSNWGNQIEVLNLVGLPFKGLGLYPLNPITIYDLEAGEEVHREIYTYHNYVSQNLRTRNIVHHERSCLSKTGTDSTLTYLIKNTYRYYSSINNSGFELDTSYLVQEEITRNKYFKYELPGNFYKNGSGYFLYVDLLVNDTYEERTLIEYPLWPLNDSISKFVYNHPLCDLSPFYLKGLGGPFVPECGNGTTYRHYKKLVFYKKGGIEFGTSLSTTPLINHEFEIEIYPNPVINDLMISINPEKGPYYIEIFSTDGKRVNQGYINSNCSISFKELENGLYILKIYSSKRELLKVEKVIK